MKTLPKALPEAWSQAPRSSLSQIQGVCFDIDDTFSSEGKITDEAYSSLWALRRAGFKLVPLTGRPAGWCDHIARFWPVDAVVGENGAFSFFMEKGIRRRLNTPGARENPRPALEVLGKKIKVAFPHAVFASDQAYREYDLAIDICEDVPPWQSADVEALLELCEREGAHAKLSSIHVNTWFGDYDKFGGFTHLLATASVALPQDLSRWIFIGDSPNDEPLFARFPYSVGVANLAPYLGRLNACPKWITSKPSGSGFRELADQLLSAQA